MATGLTVLGPCWRILVVAALIVAACSPPHEAGVSADGAEASFLTSDSPGFAADYDRARREFQSIDTSANPTGAFVLAPILRHELGHEFERVHGKPWWLDSEDFADQFAMHMTATMLTPVPEGFLLGLSEVEVLRQFMSATGGHLSNETAARNEKLICAYVGQIRAFADAKDPYAFALESAGMTRAYANYLLQYAEAQEIVAAEVPGLYERQSEARKHLEGLDQARLSSCAREQVQLREFFASKLGDLTHLERADPKSMKKLKEAQFEAWFQYEKPQTRGAQTVFAVVAPSKQGGVSSVLGNYAYLRRLGWLPANERVVVRLLYCGVGYANAQITHEDGSTVVTICYEIGEQLLEIQLQRGGSNGPNMARAMEYLRRLFPKEIDETEEEVREYSSPAPAP